MIKKIGSVLLGLSVFGILATGIHSSITYQAGHADLPAPQRPDFVQSVDVSKDYNPTTAEKTL
ncbi:Phr family secreted Rap phosphatase inhibitor [Bacillus cereus]|uniref:Phr family secreted Rap phosphatase inhibitor n=1 Tax=Bacillus cereus TaxID=1396 RepID=UPI000BEC4400|nr:Phr family secreted Rap phosphatase inhibitor [Bacillus cereus]PDZ03403.1 Phr family secreted Rap phosphatase inhibitor [Bacillus cereus]PEC53025.1 Phr family secreted Rap phosphatase inhibitor [Bacillus cereus]PFE50397.1 Phr family secreted Rap phosphatase inhibitor [Bacillus cereus]PFN15650.1 Phr family secreted Rap phosphatase inhibitor [Bacillus cereus]PFS63297.1 Phr family secreted Rap phosphatase inhibitor [Bacillus cereus]